MGQRFVQDFLYEKESYEIRGAIFDVWKVFKGVFKEKVIERALKKELENRGFKVETQKGISIFYKGEKVGEYVPDLIINGIVLIEIKVKPFLIKEDERQFWYYLRGSSYRLGFLVNFGSKKLEIRRRVYDRARERYNTLSVNQRTHQRVSASIPNGFTLIELLIVIAIIGLIAAFVVPNFREGRRKAALRQAAQKVAQDIRKAQNMAMSGVNFTTGETCGYGIHYVDQNTYVIFEDKDDDCAYGVGVFDPKCDGNIGKINGIDYICSVTTDAFADKIVETITVPGNRDVELAGSFSDILFVPPEPITYINGFPSNWLGTRIYLQLKSDNSVRKSVKVEPTGNVKIE